MPGFAGRSSPGAPPTDGGGGPAARGRAAPGCRRSVDASDRYRRPPADVSPWLAQMGPSSRGGAYAYDWIENLLGLDMHSVDRVLPEFQRPEVGDTIELGSNRMRLERVEPRHALAWRSEDGDWLLDVRACGRWWDDDADQPKPLPSPLARGTSRHAADGTRLPSDGATHVARNQATVRRARAGSGRSDRRRMNPIRGSVLNVALRANEQRRQAADEPPNAMPLREAHA
jgi:hypothetical protein